MTPERVIRVADFLRAELAAVVRKDMRDPRAALLSVTDVRVRRDLSMADVYVSSLALPDALAQDELVRVLNRAAGFLRRRLASRQSLRTMPRLRFHYDELAERGPRMQALIDAAVGGDRRAASAAAGAAHEP